MPTMPDIKCQDGEEFVYTWTAMRDGSVVNLTGFTVTIDARDKDAVAGTKRITAGACSVPLPTNGQVLYQFTKTSDTKITESADKATHIDGQYRLRFVNGAIEWKSDRGNYTIDRDPMESTT